MAGRPKADIDWEKVDKMLFAQCDGAGIAGVLGIDPETLYRRCQNDQKMGFSEYAAIKRADGKELLRYKQFEIAMTGDRSMLIWLGKQYLGQKDKTDVTTNDEAINSGEVTHRWVVEDPKTDQ